MKDEFVYSLALAMSLPARYNIQKKLIEELGSARKVYVCRNTLKDEFPDVGDTLLQAVADMDKWLPFAECEMAFAEERGIECLCWSDPRYPKMLWECPDPPIMLFYKGTADLNAQHVISIVGTRQCTEYGRTFCRHFLYDLGRLFPDTIVVSGLAYGIDVEAHRQALANGMQTVGVLGHGMERIYPQRHEDVARQMLGQGGLLTEYNRNPKVEKTNFVRRNSIVAGLATAVIVVESRERGGSLITANRAKDYDRDVYALPGRISDVNSVGCNNLIRDCKAAILSSAEDFVQQMGWKKETGTSKPIRREIAVELSEQEQVVVKALQNVYEGKNIDQLAIDTNIPAMQLMSILFELEEKGVVRLLGGARYVVV